MKIKCTLLSDTIFGNGRSIPGQEDISVLFDECGFPYFKGSSLKGIFREELQNYLSWSGMDEADVETLLTSRLGKAGDIALDDSGKFRFSDFILSDTVKKMILNDSTVTSEEIKNAFSYLRTFTAIEENGMTKEGSLRNCRCVKKGLILYGTVDCLPEDEALVKEILGLIKWVGTLRNRGFGKVRLEEQKEGC